METDDLKALNQKLEVLFVLLPLQLAGTTLDGEMSACERGGRKHATYQR